MNTFAAVVAALVAFSPMALHAQVEAAPAPAAPAIELPPVQAAATSASSAFPQLPPSNPCTADSVRGIWRMVRVHEEPQGMQTREFSMNPVQLIRFARNSTYKYVKRAKHVLEPGNFMKQFERKEGDPLQQYVVNDSGFVYFYNEGNVVDTQACFIVAEPLGNFKKGQLLLMPPAPKAGELNKSRLLRVYRKSGPPPKNAAQKNRKRQATKNRNKNKNRQKKN